MIQKTKVVIKMSYTDKRLKEKCKDQLPDYMRPFSYVILDALPKNAVGKTDVKALEEM